MRNPVTEMALLVSDKERAMAYQSAEFGVSGRIQQMKLFFQVWMQEVKDTSSLFRRCALLYSLKAKAQRRRETLPQTTRAMFQKGVAFLASLQLANEQSFTALLKSIEENCSRAKVNRTIVSHRNSLILKTGQTPDFTIRDKIEIDGRLMEYKALIPCDQLGDLLDNQNESVFATVVGCTSPFDSFEPEVASLRKQLQARKRELSKPQMREVLKIFGKQTKPELGPAKDVIKIHNETDIIEERLRTRIGESFSDAVMQTVPTDDLGNRVEKYSAIMEVLFGEQSHDEETLQRKLRSVSGSRKSATRTADPLDSRTVVTPIAEKYRNERQSPQQEDSIDEYPTITEKPITSENENDANDLKTPESENDDMTIDAINKVVFHILERNVKHSEEPEEEDDLMLVEFDPEDIPGLPIEDKQKSPEPPKYHHVWNKPKFYPIWKPKCTFNKRGPLFDPNAKPKRPQVIANKTEFTRTMKEIVSEISPMSRLMFNNGRATTRHSKTLTTPLCPATSKSTRPRVTSMKVPEVAPEKERVVSFAGGGRSVGRNTGNFMNVRINNSRRRTTRPISTAKSLPTDLNLSIEVGPLPQSQAETGIELLTKLVSSLVEWLATQVSLNEFEQLRRRVRTLRKRLVSSGYNSLRLQELTVRVKDLDLNLRQGRETAREGCARVFDIFQQNTEYSSILVDAIDVVSRENHARAPGEVDLSSIDRSMRVNYVDASWASDFGSVQDENEKEDSTGRNEGTDIDLTEILQILPSVISPDEIEAVLYDSMSGAKREYQDIMKQ